MKKKKVFSKVLAIVLVLSLMLTTFPSFSAFAQDTSSKEQLTEKGYLWQPESNSNALNFEGDLSIEKLQKQWGMHITLCLLILTMSLKGFLAMTYLK